MNHVKMCSQNLLIRSLRSESPLCESVMYEFVLFPRTCTVETDIGVDAMSPTIQQHEGR